MAHQTGNKKASTLTVRIGATVHVIGLQRGAVHIAWRGQATSLFNLIV